MGYFNRNLETLFAIKSVTISDFHNKIIVAQRIHNDVIVMSIGF